MLSADAISKLLLTLYAAPLRPELWTTFLGEFTRLLGLPAAAILHQDLAKAKYEFAISSGMDPVAERLYGEHYGKIDPWRPRFLTKQEGEIAFGDELCSAPELRNSEFYADYLSKWDINLCTAVATIKRPDNFELISIYRGLHAEMPGPDVIAVIQLLGPHIHTALQLRHQLFKVTSAAASFEETLNSLSVGVVLLNDRGECVFVSRTAETLCARQDGIYIRKSRLGAVDSLAQQKLQQLIAAATGITTSKSIKPCGVTSLPRRFQEPLLVSAVPLSPQACLNQLPGSQAAVAALFIRSPEDEAATLPGILMTAYGLTAAEVRLASRLYGGCSLSEAAARGAVSRETLRVQLRSIFDKMQVRRQVDLVRLLGNLTTAQR